jgi:hypothetical protein
VSPKLQDWLAVIENGDVSALGPFADWLEENGDSRAKLPREAAILHFGNIGDHPNLMRVVADELYWLMDDSFSLLPNLSRMMTEDECLQDVEEDFRRGALRPEVVRAIYGAQRASVNRLAEQFKETPPVS